MKGIFFKEDIYLQSLNLDTKIERFILSFKEIFGELIINEVFIIFYNGERIIPLYFFCGHTNCDNSENIPQEKLISLKEEKLKAFEFFVENILRRQCILNNEGIIAKDQIGGLFDAMFRMDDYYIGLNNTENSFNELKEKIGIREEPFINIVKKLYKELRTI
ncbi:MAG: hypothetical protein PHZ26_05940 [Candidatus Gracilibacteria bacterium]|nr:hypothetical protein [Candidatus Gracilibacteria bacterium]MDD2909254.1 hypothetical protein [Candidatus Gracilibacteria bacterium]